MDGWLNPGCRISLLGDRPHVCLAVCVEVSKLKTEPEMKAEHISI